jgi:hypothetical protein
MRCFPALERTRTPEKDISFKNIGLILLSQEDERARSEKPQTEEKSKTERPSVLTLSPS